MKRSNERQTRKDPPARRDQPRREAVPPRDGEREHGLYEDAAQDEEQERHSPSANDVY